MQGYRRQRRHSIGHVAGSTILNCGKRGGIGAAACDHQVESAIAQGAAADACGVSRIGPVFGESRVNAEQRVSQRISDQLA